MSSRTTLGFLIVALLAVCGSVFAQTPPPAKLRVAVVLARPFCFQQDNGYDGYSIELWKYLSREAGLSYEFTFSGKAADCLNQLVDGKVDAVVGPISITSWREPLMDFTYPYYESGIGVLVSKGNFGAIPYLRFFLSWRLLALAGILIVAITINAHVIWMLERKANPEAFPSGYLRGLAEGVWYSIGIVLVGYGDKEIRAGAGRAAAVVWMLAGVAIYSYVMSSLISFVTVSNLTSDITGIDDLRGKTVAIAENAPAQKYFSQADLGVNVQVFPNFQEALDALAKGKVTAIADDVPMLRYEMRHHNSGRFLILDGVFEKGEYAFALRKDSPYRKTLDEALLKAQEEGFLEELKQLWFGDNK